MLSRISTILRHRGAKSLPACHLTQQRKHATANKPPFRKILIANRGEIALRVMRTARQHDIQTVAIYSTADAKSVSTRLLCCLHSIRL